MSAEVRKSSVEINREVHKGTGQTVCQADIIVPDTMPDALKVLQVDGRAVFVSTVVSKGKISVSGHVDCNLLYVPENARGVKSIDYEIPFTYSENIPGAEEDMFFLAKCQVSHIEYQLVNSRKIGVKAVVEAENEVIGKEEVSYVCGVEGDNAQYQTTLLKGRNRIVCKCTEFTVSDSIAMPKNAAGIMKCDSEIKSKDVKVINNKVVAKGMIEVCLLYINSDDMPECEKTAMQFTEILDAEGINENLICGVDYFIIGTDVHEQEGENGRELKLEVSVRVCITGEEKVEFTAITDIYGTDVRLVPEVEKIAINEKGEAQETMVQLREIVSLPEGMPEVNKPVGIQVKPVMESCGVSGSGIKVDGEAICYLTYISEKEDALIQTAVFNLPFSGSMSFDTEGAKEATAEVETQSAECSISGNNIELRIQMKITAETMNRKEYTIVKNITEEEEEEGDRPAMVLYFVQKGDTVWEIAKRYHSKIGDIEAINKIDGDNIKEGMMLLIPKK